MSSLVGLADIRRGWMKCEVNPLPPSDAVRLQFISEDFFQFGIVTFRKTSPLWRHET